MWISFEFYVSYKNYNVLKTSAHCALILILSQNYLCVRSYHKKDNRKYVYSQMTSIWPMCISKFLYRYIANQVNLWLYISCLAFSDVHEKFVNIKVKFSSIIINFYVMQNWFFPILTKTTFHKNIILFSGQWKSIFKGLVKNCSCVDNNEI